MLKQQVRKIDVAPREVYWSDGGDLLLLACEESYFVLRYDASIVAAAIQVHLFFLHSVCWLWSFRQILIKQRMQQLFALVTFLHASCAVLRSCVKSDVASVHCIRYCSYPLMLTTRRTVSCELALQSLAANVYFIHIVCAERCAIAAGRGNRQ
jgi:hypothetical protein